MSNMSNREWHSLTFGERLARLRMTKRQLANELGMDQRTVGRAVDDPETVTRASYERIDQALNRLWEEMGLDDDEARPTPGVIVFRVKGGAAEAVIEAPVENIREAEDAVARLMERFGSNNE